MSIRKFDEKSRSPGNFRDDFQEVIILWHVSRKVVNLSDQWAGSSNNLSSAQNDHMCACVYVVREVSVRACMSECVRA